MTANYSNSFYRDYEKVCNKLDAVLSELTEIRKEHKKEKQDLTKKIDELTKLVISLQKIIEEKDKEILRLKNKNDKDSSNSSKPSSINGYKKVITNRREKSNKSKGGQKNHEPHSLKNKLEQFINSGNIEEEIIEINKNEINKNKRYIEKVVIDIKVTKIVKRYRYYICDDGRYHIPEIHNQYVQYGNNIKSMAMDLMINLPNSTDGIVEFISDISNNGITLSKGTLINWESILKNNLSNDIQTIENELLDSYYINHDESQIKIDGDGHNVLCACNNKFVRLWPSKYKSQDAIDEIGFLPKFKGVIVKDGTELYNKYGIILTQCISHVQRYLKGIYDFVDHKAPKKLSEFFSKYINLRNEYIDINIDRFSDNELSKIIEEYNSIINEWEAELKHDLNNYLFDDELKLFTRLKYDNKKMDSKIRGDRDEVLYFLRDFNVPSTNNNAESSQRGVKIKQKIGKFRSEEGAKNYLVVKSCILTFKKQKLDILNCIKQSFECQTILAN